MWDYFCEFDATEIMRMLYAKGDFEVGAKSKDKIIILSFY